MYARIILALAGLAGAGGVALAAVAAHVTGGTTLATAAQFMILHGAAAVGLVALAWQGAAARLTLAAASVMLLGVTLFSGDLALRQLAGTKLLWGAAPVGGTLMILGWLLVVGVAALVGRR